MIGKNGEYTIGYELNLPPIFTIPENVLDDLAEKFSQGIKILPNYCRIHRQDFISNETIDIAQFVGQKEKPSFFEDEYIRTYSSRPVMCQKSYIYFTLIPKTYHNVSVLSANMVKTRGFLDISQNSVTEFDGQVEQFMTILGSVINQNEEGQPPYITYRRLSADDYLRTVSSKKDGVLAKHLFLSDPIYSDVIYNDNTSELRVGEKYVEIFSLSSLENVPAEVKSSIDYGIYNLPTCWAAYLSPILKFPHILNTYIIKGDNEVEKDSLERNRNFLKAFPTAANQLGAEEIGQFLISIESEKVSVVDVHANIILWDNDLRELSVKKQSVGAMLATLGFENPKAEVYNKMNIFIASLPGNVINIFEEYRFKTIDIVGAMMCNYVSLQQTDLSGKGLRVVDRLSKSPLKIYLDEPFDKYGYNMNMFALGVSGAGKSFAMNHIMNNELENGSHAVIIDIGKSYEGLCSAYNGKWFEFTDETPLSFNPFILSEYDWQKSENTLAEEKLQALSGIIKVLWKGPEGSFSQTESNIVKDLLTGYYRNHDIKKRDFNSFYEYALNFKFDYTFDTEEFFYNLKICYKEGSYPKLLNAAENESLLNERLIIFELDNIKRNAILLSITTTVIMDVFVSKMRNLPGKKIIMFEEAWAALNNEEMSGYIQWLAKTARKFNAKLIVVTQELNDILNSKVGKALISNCSEKFLLDLSNFKENFNEIQTVLGLNDFQKAQILSINKGKEPGDKSRDFFIGFQYGKSTVATVSVSRAETLLYSSSQEEKNGIKYIANKLNLSYAEAIKYIIQHLIQDIDSIRRKKGCNFYEAIKSLPTSTTHNLKTRELEKA